MTRSIMVLVVILHEGVRFDTKGLVYMAVSPGAGEGAKKLMASK